MSSLNYHAHSHKLKSQGFSLRKNLQIKKINNNYYLSLIWFKDIPQKRTKGVSLGLDMGYHKLIATSDKKTYNGNLSEIYNKIAAKKQGIKAFKKSLLHRDNEINRICNSLPLDNVKTLIIEDLKNVKHGAKYYDNKVQRWSYAKTIIKLKDICDLHGINMVKVSPSYTSQTCSSCGHVDENSRNKEKFSCTSCGFKMDADINASINIRNRGDIVPLTKEIHYYS